MKTVTIRNNFHNTEANVRVGRLSPRTIARVRRDLCGIPGCCCGGNLSERGQQDAEILVGPQNGQLEVR